MDRLQYLCIRRRNFFSSLTFIKKNHRITHIFFAVNIFHPKLCSRAFKLLPLNALWSKSYIFIFLNRYWLYLVSCICFANQSLGKGNNYSTLMAVYFNVYARNKLRCVKNTNGNLSVSSNTQCPKVSMCLK